MGVYFSKDKPGNGEAGAIYMSGDHVMKSTVNKVYNGFFNWEKVCNVYTAKGDEKFITIGNFDLNDKTTNQAAVKHDCGCILATFHHKPADGAGQ